MNYARNTHDGNDMRERSLDLILSCGACMSKIFMLTAAMSDSLTQDALCKLPPDLGNVALRSLFELVLFRATAASLPGFYRDMGNPAEWPCIRLGLCRCFMRPLYAAIYFNNAWMLSTLLRYGAEVRPWDTCRCEPPSCLHPLLRVYKTLASINGLHSGATCSSGSRAIPFVRCHQLATLVMPCHNAELLEACYAFAKAFSPDSEYEMLLREKESLQHRCRLTIRAALARRRAMPVGVEQLPLPKLLQRYILYQYGPGCV